MSSFSIYMPYRPEPGFATPVETDLVQAIRRAADKPNFVTWKGESGWVVSYVFPDGQYVDVGFAGNGERPDCSRGMIESMVSLIRAGVAGKGPLHEAQRAIESKRRSHLNKLIDQQGEQLEYRKHLRRKQTAHRDDHPLVNPK